MEIQELLNECEAKADKTIENFKRNLSSIRTGRASTSLLDRVSPWERTMLGEIEKAILKSDLGLNPNNDGTIIRLEIPQLTEERRKELSKKVGKEAEDAKVAVRNIRRDSNDAVKKSEKKKEITEDDSKEAQTKIQKITDAKIKQIDEIKDKKEKEVMEV